MIISQNFPNLGSQDSFDFMTWNIEWFPKNGQTTINYVAEIIEDIDVDVIAMQELDDRDLFDQMISSLDGYAGYYDSSWFAGLAFIYNTETVQVNDIYEIYTTSPYWNAFPRSPMVMDLNFNGVNYFLINNHFKCCGDGSLDLNDDSDEEKRRYDAINLLRDYIDENLPNQNVIVLGDLNDDIAEPQINNVFQLIINDPNYEFVDYQIALGSSSDWSFPNWPSHLDHILVSDELFEELAYSHVETIKLDQYIDGGWNEYDYNISDHRPVFMQLAQNVILGDVSGDGSINILDVVMIVQIVIGNDEIVQSADFNVDGSINILDVVQLIQIIIS
tara:strand:- start:3699 stop:4694 length:996 start_codon:yes stop_codon:yes gene_type:complete